jgi:hypothetical protein
MRQNYFIVNGKKYYTGTVFIVKNYTGKQVEATFVCYDTDYSRYVYRTQDCMHRSDDKHFWNNFIAVINNANKEVNIPVAKTKKDLEISGLFIGWVWYIFLMLVSTIFKDAVGMWILISVVFFSWRSKKIKEEGTYIEW